MSPERRIAFAKALKKNALLPVLVEERRSELRDEWESGESAEKREQLWQELNALNQLWDFLDARINSESTAG